MKGYSSLHNHTAFCDGENDVETMCRSAFEKGLSSIGFSAHAPVGKTGLETDWHLKDARLAEYMDDVRAAGRRWEGKIAVYLGLELDYIKGLRSAMDGDIRELVLQGSLDFLIGSVHYIVPPNGNLLTVVTVDESLEQLEEKIQANLGGDGQAMMNIYWDSVLEMVGLGGFDIVGHLDLVKKHNGKGRWFDEEGQAYLQRAEEAVRAIAGAGLVVEVNTGGMNRGYLDEPFPSLSILRLLRRHDVPVMINADAHREADLDGHYREAGLFLREAGYTSHVLFEGRSGGKPVWGKRPV
ncbi:MAG: histidinol-phosphatase [Treponema sp.]|nr:histidinol-phosphatase [Treponema sp.]